MVNKFLVFVVVTIVTQSSVLLTSANFNGFSEDSIALLDLLQSKDLEVLGDVLIGFGGFLDLLRNGTSETSPDQDLSPFGESLTILVGATDIVYQSALLVARGNCDGIDIALNETTAQLQEVIETLVGIIELTRGGNWDNNRNKIEYDRNLTRAVLVDAYTIVFDFFRCCISDSSDEFENLLEAVEATVYLNVDLLNNALYEAIEAYSILTSECTEDEAAAALLAIEESRYIIIYAARDVIEHVFSVFETSYIVAYLNSNDIVNGVFEIRLARKRTTDRLEEVMEVVFLAITVRLLQYSSHHEIGSRNSTLDDPTQAMAADFIQSAEEHFLEAVSHTLPNSVDNAMVARTLLPHILSKIISHYYNGMDLAEADNLPLNLSLLAIEIIKKVQNLLTSFVVDTCFNIIGSDARIEALLADMQKMVTVSLDGANNATFAAIEILSEVAHGTDGASEDDLNKVHSLLLAAIAAVSNAARVQLHAVLDKYIIESGY